MTDAVHVLAKMRAAQIPTHAYTSSLKIEKQEKLAQIIKARDFERGAAGMKSYFFDTAKSSKRSAARVAAVFAKELVLAGVKVYYTTLAEMALAHRMYERSIESAFFTMDRLGKGYIVLGEMVAVEGTTHTEWRDVQMLLCAHVSRGGGLILGNGRVDLHTSNDFALMMESFETVNVE